MAPSRRKGTSKAAAAAAACRKWKVGDLVLAKVKGFPPWPATVSEPEKWGYSNDWRKVLVYFFGTQQIAFCNPADVEAFTEEKKESLLKRQGKGSDFVRAVKEIVDSYEKLKKQEHEGDGSSGIEVAPANGGNSVESSTNLQGALAEASDLVSKSSNSKVKDMDEQDKSGGDDAMAAQIDDSKHVTGGHADNGIAKETSILSTYSLRKKSGGPQSERSSAQTQRRTNPVRRSRSSSRVESGRDTHILPINDDEKIAGSVLSNFVLEGSARNNRRSRETSDVSQGENMGSPACIANGSMEEHDSEIVTVDSDSISLNEGSAVDSGCKNEQFGIVECMEGDLESRKGLDLQIKAVIRKKRKPNRKRMIHDAVEPTSNLENEACSNIAINNTSQSSDTASLKVSDSFAREDGDEHLPLVKRARVRMEKLLSEDDGNTVSYTEEKNPNEAIENPSEVGMTSLNPDDGNTIALKADSSDDSVSEDCILSSEHKSQVWKRKNLPHVCSADGEAALPPSKRLHRALEAMSANVAEEHPLPDGPSAAVQTSNSACHGSSVQTPTYLTFDGIGGSLKQEMPVSLVGHSSMCPITLSPNFSQKVVQLDGDLEGQVHGEVIEKVRDAVEQIDTCPSANVDNGLQHVATPIQWHLSTGEACKPNLRSSPALPDGSLHAEDEADIMHPKSRTLTSNTSPKQADPSEENEVNVQLIAGTEKDDAISSVSGVNVHQESSEIYGCERVNCLKHLDDGGCQVNSLHGVNGIIQEQVPEQQDPSAPTSSLSPTDRQHSSSQASPVNNSICCTSTLVSSKFNQINGDCTPDGNVYLGRPMHGLVDEEKNESLPHIKSSGKRSDSSEAHTALSSFEAVIATLTRTKESIGRATRFAVDCGKFGIATKVVEILVRNLERESSLHKRVDLFFLVDSIMQCARGLKGDGTGAGAYPSAIQAVLPRLLSAAAPPGSSSQENRRQCLKVLRLWLERKIFSESLIRHHIRELDMMSLSSTGGAYSRRSSRTERSFDDPLREMEGMLVDEYGSNSSFQLPGFCMPRMRKDDDDGSDSDGSFEAVTPEHACENSQEEIAPIEKHRHILQDVDGELEMEDVAPSEIEMTSIQGTVNVVQNQQIAEQQFPPSFAPLLTDMRSSPRLLPSPHHPPPPPPPPPPLPHPALSSSTISDHYVNVTEQSANGSTHGNVGQSLGHQAVPPRIEPAVPGAVHHHATDYRDHQKQAPMSCSPSSYMRRPLNNGPETDGPVYNHKSYPMRPPPPPPSNQFSYIQSDQRFRPRRDGPPPSHSRHHFSHNRGNGNYYNNHDRMKPPPHEIRENWRFSAPYSGPRYSEKGKNSYPPGPYDGPPCDSPRFQNHGWGCPPRPMNHRDYVPFRPHYEGPGYWQPR